MTKPPAAGDAPVPADDSQTAPVGAGGERATDDAPRYEADYAGGETPTPAEWPAWPSEAATEPTTVEIRAAEPTTVETPTAEPTTAEVRAAEPTTTEAPAGEATRAETAAAAEATVTASPAETTGAGTVPAGTAAAEDPAAATTAPPPPPGAAPPPPPGAATPPPPPPPGNQPPFGAAFNRSLLVRPQQGRYVAGVCAAIGRATNTDPTLWRVIFAVLTLAGGVSIVAYLLGWLLLPAEGDTGSPLESLLGRGRSTTSAPAAIIIGVAAVLAFLLVMSQNLGAAAVGLAVVIGVVALLVRGQGNQQAAPAGPFVPPAVPNPGSQPGPFAAQFAGRPSAPGPFGPRPFGPPPFGPRPAATQQSFGSPPFGSPSSGPPSFGSPSFGSATTTAPSSGSAGDPSAAPPVAGFEPGAPVAPADPAAPTVRIDPATAPADPAQAQTQRVQAAEPSTSGYEPATYEPPAYEAPRYEPSLEAEPAGTNPPLSFGGGAGYRPPFAPHGPFAGGNSPYAASLGYPPPPPPGIPTAPYPGLAPTPPPKRPKERSKLGRITFSLIVLSLGVLAALEVTVADFKASTFFAVPLAITALGLITGAWIGRARVLILLGALLSIALAISTAASTSVPHQTRNIRIAPTSVNALSPRYSTDFGTVSADLTGINFVDQNVATAFRVGAGSLDVTVPPDVDVTVDVHVQGGDCMVFGNDCGGFKQTSTFTDYGRDGPGGGKLHLNLDVQWGDVRVTR